jgi:crossover junction endodeoxyribonuclease RuvC
VKECKECGHPIYLGIDPGKAGAIGIIEANGNLIGVIDMPEDPAGLVAAFLAEDPAGSRVIVERQQSMPHQGVASSFQTGKGYGQILGVLAAMGLPHEIISPGVWKKAMGLSADKQKSREMARRLWPSAPLHLQKHDGRAESLLLAEWLRRRETK